jgi:hypothetical protein
MSSYYYSRTKGGVTKRCLITIELNIDVEGAIYEALAKCKQVPLDYKITDIEPACEGCLNEYLGQRDHMLCPYGCLHDRNSCILCNI